MKKFSAVCIDASYDAECLYMKKISGYAFKNGLSESYIYESFNRRWYEVKPETLRITDVNGYVEDDDDF